MYSTYGHLRANGLLELLCEIAFGLIFAGAESERRRRARRLLVAARRRGARIRLCAASCGAAQITVLVEQCGHQSALIT